MCVTRETEEIGYANTQSLVRGIVLHSNWQPAPKMALSRARRPQILPHSHCRPRHHRRPSSDRQACHSRRLPAAAEVSLTTPAGAAWKRQFASPTTACSPAQKARKELDGTTLMSGPGGNNQQRQHCCLTWRRSVCVPEIYPAA